MPYTYSFLQWMLFFYIYSFVGWIIESTIVSIDERKFVNRGFLRSPFLPLYGFGAIVILFVSLPVKENPFWVYVCGMVGTTILEYFTGWLMESLFKVKYWDYSGQKFNIKGRIALTSSLFWGLLSLFLTYILHKPIETLVLGMDKGLNVIIVAVISCLFVSDTIYAFKTALDVNKLLEKITKIKSELEQLKAQLNEKLESSERSARIHARIAELKAEHSAMLEKISYFHKELIKAHPSATSSRFNEALKELKAKIYERRNKS